MDSSAADHRWWHGAVLYQLYVRSWLDADRDGYGDLRGVIAGLEHLAWLGVDGIWLSPTMPSPDHDWGYDVSDYLGVHPDLGTLDDLDHLIAEADKRGLRVLLDLVPNHTSSAHPWFVDALGGPDSAHRGFYVWADPDRGGGPPNNWRDATGRPAWTLDKPSGQYYLHNFLETQPDLNWWEPAVHDEFGQILRFWLDRGVAGFRIDVAHGLYKDAQLRDNPPFAGHDPLLGSFGLKPVYNANRPETHGVYRDWRRIAESYPSPRLLLGETWVGDFARLAAFYGQGDELQLAFNFPFIFARFTVDELAEVVAQTLAHIPAGACPVWTGSNHDVGRFPTRWCGGDERKIRLALLVLATLPGTTVLYYGDEIGMTDVDVPPEMQRDQMTLGGLENRGNRDRARTPMHWDPSPTAGFTSGAPWLPVGDNAACNVVGQREDHASTLWFCRRLLALRRAEFGGQITSYVQLSSANDQWVYRVGALTVAANFSAEPTAPFDPGGRVVLSTPSPLSTTEPRQDSPGSITLGPWQGVIVSPEGSKNDPAAATEQHIKCRSGSGERERLAHWAVDASARPGDR
ncbi:MAG: alpha-amylase family glycosyl hydrolase [Frankiaceae bacterium]